jgi:hypothetical protein
LISRCCSHDLAGWLDPVSDQPPNLTGSELKPYDFGTSIVMRSRKFTFSSTKWKLMQVFLRLLCSPLRSHGMVTTGVGRLSSFASARLRRPINYFPQPLARKYLFLFQKGAHQMIHRHVVRRAAHFHSKGYKQVSSTTSLPPGDRSAYTILSWSRS